MAMDWYISSVGYKPHNIYITSDEEIKVGDYVIEFQKGNVTGDVYLIKNEYTIAPDIQQKIILTDDKTLIDDGIQEIPDEFLGWLVKNPSCEEVEVKKRYSDFTVNPFVGYRITIQQEEPKPHSFCETPEEKCTMNYCDENGCQNRVRHLVEPQEELKQDLEKEMFELEQELDIPSNLRWHNSKPKQEIIATEEDAKIFLDTIENPLAPNEKLKTAFIKHEFRAIPKEEVLANRCNAYEFIDFDKKETLEDKLKSLVKEWQERQWKYEDVAQTAKDEHNDRKFTYKAMATRDCWKELLKLIEDEK